MQSVGDRLAILNTESINICWHFPSISAEYLHKNLNFKFPKVV